MSELLRKVCLRWVCDCTTTIYVWWTRARIRMTGEETGLVGRGDGWLSSSWPDSPPFVMFRILPPFMDLKTKFWGFAVFPTGIPTRIHYHFENNTLGPGFFHRSSHLLNFGFSWDYDYFKSRESMSFQTRPDSVTRTFFGFIFPSSIHLPTKERDRRWKWEVVGGNYFESIRVNQLFGIFLMPFVSKLSIKHESLWIAFDRRMVGDTFSTFTHPFQWYKVFVDLISRFHSCVAGWPFVPGCWWPLIK